MLKLLTLENFKAFGEQQRIELAPITLIFGQNSAGKSSILQSLNLLKQTLENPYSSAALLPRVEGGLVDLGSFHELLFDHDTKRKLRIGLQVDTSGRGRAGVLARRLRPLELPGVEIGFHSGTPRGDVSISDLSITDKDLKSLARFSVTEASDRERRELSRFANSRLQVGRRAASLVGRCDYITEDDEFWGPIHRAWFDNRDAVAQELGNKRKELGSQPEFEFGEDEDADALMRSRLREQEQELDAAIRFYSREFSVVEYRSRILKWAGNTRIAFDRFLPVRIGPISRRNRLPEWNFYDRRGLGGFDPEIDLPFFDVSELADFAGLAVAEALDDLFPMGPYRRPPERWYIFTGSSPRDVGYKGDHLPDLLFRRPELVDKANAWLSRLEVGYELRVRPVGEREGDLFEVRLLDSRRATKVEVALADVGFGISQLLPFLVQSLASRGQTISIEQPEVHIHPRLQADLGDLIAEAIKRPYEHQFLIETHSEHLILRIQKLVRSKILRSSDVSVLYVSRGSAGSRVQRLHLDEQGEFIDDWPGGFFSERLRELI